MPEGTEYLHCAQIAVDEDGLRYQVLDEDGKLREHLSWPPRMPRKYEPLSAGHNVCLWSNTEHIPSACFLSLQGKVDATSPRQTILAALDDHDNCPLWIGLIGQRMQLTVVMQPQRGRSPHQWLGPCFADGDVFDLEIMLNADMGPGGVLWRKAGTVAYPGFFGVKKKNPRNLFASHALVHGVCLLEVSVSTCIRTCSNIWSIDSPGTCIADARALV